MHGQENDLHDQCRASVSMKHHYLDSISKMTMFSQCKCYAAKGRRLNQRFCFQVT